MQLTSGIPTLQSDCPQEFRWFFFGKWETPFLCIQDATHMCVKTFRRLMNKQLRIGSGLASRSILLSLTETSPKMIIGITTAELSECKDAMNYGIVEKVCSDKVLTKLVQPQEYGTKVYLQLNRHFMKAYIDASATPTERLHSAWYTVFFCRLWKESIFDRKRDTDEWCKASLKDNFITTNVHVCTEINGHALTKFLIECRDLHKPELFLPHQTGSQQCEVTFRTLRSMSSMFFTAINFDIMEILQKIKRIFVSDSIVSSNIDFNFARQNKKAKIFVAESLPSNGEINEIVLGGWEEARNVFSNLGQKIFLVL